MTIKEAMVKIQSAMIELYGEQIIDVRLEEMSLPLQEGSGIREITVSFLLPEKNPLTGIAAAMVATVNKNYTRLYKTIEFDMNKGEILAIRMFKE